MRSIRRGWLPGRGGGPRVADAPPRGRLLIVANVAWFFVSHRLPLGIAAREAGWDVHVAALSDSTVAAITDAGLAFHQLSMSRSGLGASDVGALRRLRQLYRTLEPDLVHHVTIKPVLLGSLAARREGVPAVINAFSGLGTLFLSQGPVAAARRELVLRSIARAGQGRHYGLFQNASDRDGLVGRGVVAASRAVIIPGSGVDLARFAPTPEPGGTPIVLLPARMLRDKGVIDFVAAAHLLAREGRRARFVLVGRLDPANASAIQEGELRQLASGTVEWWGERCDMPAVLAGATIVCLPSYGEGLPKALAEAAAAGRAIVATDVPGCRDVVQDGVTGLLVPVRDPVALARAIARLLDDPTLRARLASAARVRAESTFDVRQVVQQTLDLYDRAVAG